MLYGLTTEEFESSTQTYLNELHDIWEKQQEKEDSRFALLCSVIANTNRNSKVKKTPYKVEDFMPRRRPRTKDELVKKIKQLRNWTN